MQRVSIRYREKTPESSAPASLSSHTNDRALSHVGLDRNKTGGSGEVQRHWAKLFSGKTLFATVRAGRKVRSAWKIVNRKLRGACRVKLSLRIRVTACHGAAKAALLSRRHVIARPR